MPTFNRQAFRPFVFVMGIRIAYRSDLIGQISALVEFSYTKIVPRHAMPVEGGPYSPRGRNFIKLFNESGRESDSVIRTHSTDRWFL